MFQAGVSGLEHSLLKIILFVRQITVHTQCQLIKMEI